MTYFDAFGRRKKDGWRQIVNSGEMHCTAPGFTMQCSGEPGKNWHPLICSLPPSIVFAIENIVIYLSLDAADIFPLLSNDIH